MNYVRLSGKCRNPRLVQNIARETLPNNKILRLKKYMYVNVFIFKILKTLFVAIFTDSIPPAVGRRGFWLKFLKLNKKNDELSFLMCRFAFSKGWNVNIEHCIWLTVISILFTFYWNNDKNTRYMSYVELWMYLLLHRSVYKTAWPNG